MTGDEFAQRLLDDQPDGIAAAIDALVAKRTRRPVTRTELIEQLTSSFPGFTAELRRRAERPHSWTPRPSHRAPTPVLGRASGTSSLVGSQAEPSVALAAGRTRHVGDCQSE